jgi:dTDP-4-amino-4,6-dideoxygalactose transaminase
LPITDQVESEILSLPVHTRLGADDLRTIAAIVHDAVR